MGPKSAKMNRIQFDGACFPNPGDMGIGVVLLEDEIIITQLSKRLGGIGTNNIAEYTALIWGLEKAIELGWKNVIIEGDSNLVISQINGNFKVHKEHLTQLLKQVKLKLTHFDGVTIRWIPRENNTRADHLASKALELDENNLLVNKPNNYNPYEKKMNENIEDIFCQKCNTKCKFVWQEFKTGETHIQQICPKHGHIRYVKQIEPFISLANENKSKENTLQIKLF